ncbi:hypothetical protein N752_23945 [Desulforamulus aquiferis]|nr:hypothetical protein N752_23945 [Desulforamulus aquiferis]
MQSIPSVSSGDVLAIKIQGQLGKPGKNVLGQEIRVNEPKRINLLSGFGVQIIEDGIKAIAQTEGLPVVQKSGTNYIISVDPVLKIPEDVNVKTGNIRFKGNVTILGSVENDMSVSASGDITVSNIITRCTIIAGGNVTVKGNIVNSEIISGGFFVICNTLKPPLQELGKALENLLLAGAIMYDKLPPNTNINFGNVLVLLIEKRYTNFIGLLDKIQKMFKELDMKLLGEYDHKLQKLVNNLHLIKLVQYQTPADFEATINELNSFFYYAARHEKNRSLVDVNVVLNSVIKSSGDVMVQGAGCFNTHIIAEGNVTVNGVVRGGVIEAKDDIFIKELGSEFSSKSVVITAKDKKIKITNAFEGVKVQVGKMQKVLEKKMTNIEVSLDEEGYLQIKNF